MKYKTGDKFIVEIDRVIEIDGVKEKKTLYRIKKTKSLVFDKHGLDRLEQVHEHDGCDGCKYERLSPGQEPCESCRCNYVSRYEPKPKEIQVGDIVEYDGEFGIVVHRNGTHCTVLDRNLDKRAWGVRSCTRTGKTYPELIKALAELPKEE